MEIATCLVALGGDIQNTVPKYNVTPAEFCVLAAVHGEGAVTEIVPAGDVERSNREELTRLRDPHTGYGRAQDNDGKPIVNGVFPGAGARVPETFAELDLPEALFKVVAAPKVAKAKRKAAQTEDAESVMA